MGVPTAAQFQGFTDLEAAELEDFLDGFLNVCKAKTVSGMASLVDAVGDASFEGRVMTLALARDLAALPEDARVALGEARTRAAYSAWWRGLEAALIAEGGYASLDAYLTAKSATVQALWAEAFGGALGTTLTAANVLAPQYGVAQCAAAYTGTDGALVDVTTDINSVAAGDVTLFAADNDRLYIRSPRKFNRLCFGLDTLASADITALFTYSNGPGYGTLTCTDNTTGFRLNQPISFAEPTDWEPTDKDTAGNQFTDKGRLYTVCLQRTADALAQPPVATILYLMPSAVLDANGAHLGYTQGPLGLLRITANDTISAESLNVVAYSKWAPPTIRLRALNALGANAQVTISYKNQAGADQTQLQTDWVSPAAGATKAMTLNGADTGVRQVNVTGWAVTSNGRGVIAVESVLGRTPAI